MFLRAIKLLVVLYNSLETKRHETKYIIVIHDFEIEFYKQLLHPHTSA